LECTDLKVYNQFWQEIIDLSQIQAGDQVYLMAIGYTDHPSGITDARFRIIASGVDSSWRSPTGQYLGNYYLQYVIPSGGTYHVEAMVYNPDLGWK
jgi:hypothetical protein